MRTILAPVLFLAFACSSGASKPESAGPAEARSGVAAPPAREGVQLQQTFPALPPGKEVHYCQYFVLPERAIDVQRVEHSYTPGGHHVILYPTKLHPADVAGRLGVFDCDDGAPNRGDAGFGYVGAGTEGSLEYPTGVAYHYDERAVVLLESHMLNLTTDPLDVDYRVNLWFATEPVRDHVGTIFFYDNHILIPARDHASVAMSCAVPRDVKVLALAPHMHVRGTFLEASLRGASGEEQHLLSQTDWSALEPTRYDPPMRVSAGDRFEFTCDYDNPDPFDVFEGSSKTDDEMCLLIGSYYPRIDSSFEFCIEKGSGPRYSGTRTCAESLACFVQADNPFDTDQCAIDTCPAAGQAFNDFFNCTARECFFAGACDADDCAACALEHCGGEMATCQATGCQ
jgi:hypothetical protein